MECRPQIIVAYSHNVSQAIRVHRLPKPGETIRALQASAGMDGAKGTNSAVAAARVGAKVAMVAHVKGGDWYYKGQKVLAEAGIDDTYVVLGEGIKDTSGVVLIDDDGNNMIVLGAHNEQAIPDEEIDQALEAMKDAQYCITGYEINEKSVRHILRKARELGIKTVVNPSPIPNFVPDYWDDISILILNEVEIERMLDLAGVSYIPGNWEDCACKLREAYGVGDIVVTLGEKGFFCLEGDKTYSAPGISVKSKDTTGAGDGFLGSMTARLAMGDSLYEACRYANRYCAITVQRDGTISSYPMADEAEVIFEEMDEAKKPFDMYDYILESKEAVRNIVAKQDEIFADALAYCEGKKIEQIYLLGSGTSYHAAVSAKKVMEDTLGVKVFHMYPMEFVDNEKVFNPNTLVIGVSQAGRSTSTLQAIEKAKAQGLMTMSVTAKPDVPVAQAADCNVLLAIGEELAGPKTKGYEGSIATLALLGLKLAVKAGKITESRQDELIDEMVRTSDQIPDIAAKAWEWYKSNSEDLKKCRRFIVLGYESCMGAMLEGTLKILEAVRYSVTGYELEEFMHGIYHAIDQDTYLIYLGSQGKHFERMERMMKYFADERGAHNYMITSERSVDDPGAFVYPFVNSEYFASMEYVVPMQVLARKLSLDLGIDCNIPSDPLFHKKMGSYTY